jgi:hypothetical protein
MTKNQRTLFKRMVDETSSPIFTAIDSGSDTMISRIQFMCLNKAIDLAAPNDVL